MAGTSLKARAALAWRDYVTDGNPASGAHDVAKSDVRTVMAMADALSNLSVISATTTAEPGAPAAGDLYIIPAGKTGAAWAAMTDGALALYEGGAWTEIAPREGWRAFIQSSDELVVWSGTAWALMTADKTLRVSATDKVLGRATAGAGAAEEIAFTSSARQLCDDASFAAMCATLGAPQLSASNTFTGAQQEISAAAPIAMLRHTGAAADQKRWATTVNSSGQYSLGTYTDAGAFGATALTAIRSGTAVTFVDVAATFRPAADNSTDFGASGRRIREIFAANATINTSDAREKTPLEPIPAGVKRAVKKIIGGMGVYRWLASVAVKGDAARLHVGVTAQAVEAAFREEGEDPARWALFCADAVEETVEERVKVKAARPVMHVVERPGVRFEDGRAIACVIEAEEQIVDVFEIEDEAGAKTGATIEVPRVEEVEIEEVHFITRPKLDEAGAPLVRLGLRYNELFALMLAVLAEDAAA